MKDIIEYITEKKLDHVVLTFAQTESILNFIEKNKLTDKAKKQSDDDWDGWYDTLKTQVDKNS